MLPVRHILSARRLGGSVFFAAVCLLGSRGRAMDVAAHRGGYALAPENTLAAFRSCAGNADWIEFDVHASADGHLVVIHDTTLDRTTGSSGTVSDLTLAQIKTADAGAKFSPAFAGETIPTLAEALRSIPPGIRPIIDRKAGTAAAYVDIIRAENAVSRVMLSSFDWPFLGEVHALEPRIALAAIGSGSLAAGTLLWMKERGIYTVAWEKSSITLPVTDRIHTHGMRVFAWTLDSLQVPAFLQLGVDGVMVNDPHLAVKLLDQAPPSNDRLSKGILAYWKLDDGLSAQSAQVAVDVEGYSCGQLGTPGLSSDWNIADPSGMGGSLLLDGTQNHVMIPASRQTDIGTAAVTLSLWVKLSVLPSSLGSDFAGIYDSESDAYILYLDRRAGELRFKITDDALRYARVGIPEAQLSTGVWHHVAGVFDGAASPAAGQAMLYLDGQLKTIRTGANDTPRHGLTGRVRPGQVAAIGRNGAQSAHYFAGAVDDVAIWNRAIRPAEIRRIHAAGTAGIPLESIIMNIRLEKTAFIPLSRQMEMQFRVKHAIAADRRFLLHSAPRPDGPYGEHPAEMTIENGAVHCRILLENGTTAPRFLRLASP